MSKDSDSLLSEVRLSAGRPKAVAARISAIVFFGSDFVLAGDSTGRLLAWKTSDFARPPAVLTTLPSRVRCLAVAPDLSWLGASAACFSVRCRNDAGHTQASSLGFELTPLEEIDPAACEDAYCAHFLNRCGKSQLLWLVGGAQQVISVRSLPSGDLIATLAGHEHIVHGLSASSCGRWLASAGGGSTRRRLILWSISECNESGEREIGGGYRYDATGGCTTFTQSSSIVLLTNASAITFVEWRKTMDFRLQF